MTEDPVTPSRLAAWLQPASIELDQGRLEALLSVVTRLASEIQGYELGAVRAAHGRLDDPTRTWAAAVLGEQAPTVRAEDSVDLLRRLVAAAVLVAVDGSGSGLRCALAVESARFLGLSPVIDELPGLAAQVLAARGWAARRRTQIPANPAATALGPLPRARKPNEETNESVDPNGLAEDVAKQASGLRSLVTAVDQTFKALAARQVSLDEEVEMLWWALRATDDNGTDFAALKGPERVVRAAAELARRTEAIPGPPSAGPLLMRVLGDEPDTKLSLADLAAAVAVHLARLTVAPDTLLPLHSAALEHQRLATAGDDETWKTAAERTLDLDLGVKTTMAAGAAQVYRELLLERLLTASE